MQKVLWQSLIIYLTGILGLHKGIALGIAIKAQPVITAGFTALGSITAVLSIYYSGESFKKWLYNRIGNQRLEKQKGRFIKILERFGIIGLGLISSGTLGPILTIVIGLSVIRDTSRLLGYLIFGIIIWSAFLTAVAELGIDMIRNMI